MNRHPVKKWSITYPQSGDMERSVFANSFPPCVGCICVQEEHKDGGYHLHLGIELKKGLPKRKLLEWIKIKYPEDYKRIDVQSTRSAKDWEEYLMKEDAEPFVIENMVATAKRQEGIYKRYFKFLKEIGGQSGLELEVVYEDWIKSFPSGDPFAEAMM